MKEILLPIKIPTSSNEIKEHPVYVGYGADTHGKVYSRWKRKGFGGDVKMVLLDEWYKEVPSYDHSRSSKYKMIRAGVSGDKKFDMMLHRFVLECWSGFKDQGQQCRHLNGDGSDNRIENLCWGSPVENEKDKIVHGTSKFGEGNPRSIHTEEQALLVADLLAKGKSYKEISSETGIDASFIYHVAYGESWSHVTKIPKRGCSSQPIPTA